MNHRGGEIGHYRSVLIASHQIDIIAETPFPCDLDYGIILGLARRFKPAHAIPFVWHGQGSCRKRGMESCTYHVRW